MRPAGFLRMVVSFALAWLGLRLVNASARVAGSAGLVGMAARPRETARPDPLCVVVALPGRQHEAAFLGARWHDTFCRREGRA